MFFKDTWGFDSIKLEVSVWEWPKYFFLFSSSHHMVIMISGIQRAFTGIIVVRQMGTYYGPIFPDE